MTPSSQSAPPAISAPTPRAAGLLLSLIHIFYGNYGQYAVSMKDSTLELTGGDAKAEGEGNMGAVLSMMYHDAPCGYLQLMMVHLFLP